MNEPINIAIPNTSQQKMKAIVALSDAIKAVATALASVQVEVTIANNAISCGGDSNGINVSFEDSFDKKDINVLKEGNDK
jgi:hypothetical protein